MNLTRLSITAGLMCQATLFAQTQVDGQYKQAYAPAQLADSFSAVAVGGGRGGASANSLAMPRAEPGRPFSATATTQTTQTFVDGTKVTQVTAMVEYRDAEGRVRTERGAPGSSTAEPPTSITIRDTVGGVSYVLDPARKVATKLTIMVAQGQAGQVMAGGGFGGGGGGGRGGRGGGGGGGAVAAAGAQIKSDMAQAQGTNQPVLEKTIAGTFKSDQTIVPEDLGIQTVNGVVAQGSRITTVIPAGAIGNDREFRSVSERWFSQELNLLVKSVSTDPRFGTSTYELTNIKRGSPDASLFQLPADYTLSSNTAR